MRRKIIFMFGIIVLIAIVWLMTVTGLRYSEKSSQLSTMSVSDYRQISTMSINDYRQFYLLT